jgi:disulfide bond formation protein DsbB
MRSEALVILGAIACIVIVGGAIALNMTNTPISLVTAIVAALAPIIGIVLAGRTQVYAKDTAEDIVTKAIETLPPATTDAARKQAKEMLK